MPCTLTQTSERLAKLHDNKSGHDASKHEDASEPVSLLQLLHPKTTQTKANNTIHDIHIRERLENREWPHEEVPAEEEEAWEVTFPMERMAPANQTDGPPRSSTCTRP